MDSRDKALRRAGGLHCGKLETGQREVLPRSWKYVAIQANLQLFSPLTREEGSEFVLFLCFFFQRTCWLYETCPGTRGFKMYQSS